MHYSMPGMALEGLAWALLRGFVYGLTKLVLLWAVIMLGLAETNSRYRLGLGRWWGRIKLVNRFPILE